MTIQWLSGSAGGRVTMRVSPVLDRTSERRPAPTRSNSPSQLTAKRRRDLACQNIRLSLLPAD